MHIKKFQVKNYRSLEDIRIGDLTSMVILYGDNDSGKSNVLSFLEMVFRQKFIEEFITSETKTLRKILPTGFWRGDIEDFSNNFYQNNNKPIEFNISIAFDRKEILGISKLNKSFIAALPKGKKLDYLILQGKITQKNKNTAEMILLNAEFNQKKFYDFTPGAEGPEYLPEFAKDITLADRRDVFELLMSTLENCFLLIPTNRFLSNETELSRNEEAILIPSRIKNWLFQAIHNQDKETVARQISEQFNNTFAIYVDENSFLVE